MLWFAIDTKSLKANVFINGIHLNALGNQKWLALFPLICSTVSMF